MDVYQQIGVIYYTDDQLGDPILGVVQKRIIASGLPIVSCSLNEPIDFGENYVIDGERSWGTMARQIIVALEHSVAKYVFFCESDVLYHPSHFDFTPPRDDTYYYNINNWRWRFGTDTAITYDRLMSLSGLCCNRELALKHFESRIEKAISRGYDLSASTEPIWARKWGYEPGTKVRRRGGFNNEPYDVWSSEFPNIDIRHNKTLSVLKTTQKEFRHIPTGWKEINVDDIRGWNVRRLFQL